MKNTTIERMINKLLNQMFDSYYQVSILTALPGNTNRNEVLSHHSGDNNLELKHQAAYIAIATQLTGRSLYKDEQRKVVGDMIQQFNKDALKTIQMLEEASVVLMEELVQLN